MRVPLTYAPKNKMLARVKQDPNLDREVAITLPRMSFELMSMEYDGSRKRNTIHRTVRKDDDNVNKFKYAYEGVPYNLQFNLYIYVKNAEDGTKILEQILPFFTPEWNATLHILPELNISLDVPIVLNSVSSEDVYEGDMIARQALTWTLSFTMKGMFYGPVKKAPIIKFANTRFFFGGPNTESITANASDIVSLVQVSPGLDANGDATTNAEISISPLLIDVDDDWGYVIEQSGLVIISEE